MKKFTMIMALATLFIGVLAGCSSGQKGEVSSGNTSESSSGNDSGNTSGNEKVTIKFLSHNFKPWNDKLTEQAKEFMKLYPNVKIEYTTVEHADLNTKIMTSLAAKNAPTVMGVFGPWMAELVKNKWIDEAPPEVVKDIQNNTVAIAGQSAEYNGKMYGYIQHIGIPTPIINEKLYEEAGVAIPDTYQDLITANEKLDKYDKNGKLSQYGTTLADTKAGSWNVIHWSSILKAYGVDIISSDGTKPAFNTQAGLEATKMYAKLTHASTLKDAFTLEKSAMEWSGPWIRSFYKQNNANLKYKALKPLQGPSKRATTTYVWFWVVSADASAAEKKWAWRFLQFISNDKNYLDMAKDIGFISFRKANLADESYGSDPWIKAFANALDVATIYYSKDISNWEKVDTAIGQELERVVIGEQTPEQMLETAEKRVKQILAENK